MIYFIHFMFAIIQPLVVPEAIQGTPISYSLGFKGEIRECKEIL